MSDKKYTVNGIELKGVVPMEYKGTTAMDHVLEARGALLQRNLMPDAIVCSNETMTALLASIVPFNPRFEEPKIPAPGEVLSIYGLEFVMLVSLPFGKCHVTLRSNCAWMGGVFALQDGDQAITLRLDMKRPNPLNMSALPNTYYCGVHDCLVRLREDGYWVIWKDGNWTTFEELQRRIGTLSRKDKILGPSSDKVRRMMEEQDRFTRIIQAAFDFDKAQRR